MISIKINLKKNKIEKTLNTLSNRLSKPRPKVLVGLWATITYPDGESVSDVAYWNAWGTKNIPARNFFHASLSPIKKLVEALGPNILQAARRGKDEHHYYVKLGMSSVVAMRNTILMTNWPPNSTATIRAKGSSKPLVDTGLLLASIQFQLENIRDPYAGVRARYSLKIK